MLRSRNGKLAFDPISTTLNEGHIRLEPEVDLDAPGGPILRLAKNSNIRDARINDEVSKRVLAYVAPVLDQATRASGFVSVDLDHAEFPLGPGRGRQPRSRGRSSSRTSSSPPGRSPTKSWERPRPARPQPQARPARDLDHRRRPGNQRGMTIPVGDLPGSSWPAGSISTARSRSRQPSRSPGDARQQTAPVRHAAGTKVRLPISGTLDLPRSTRTRSRPTSKSWASRS